MRWPFKKRNSKRKTNRAYQAAMIGRLTADWKTNPTSADKDIIPSLKTMRARSRDLCQNNDYAKRFLNMLKVNVIGHRGIALQNKAVNANGSFDANANAKIESAWNDWGRLGTCTMCGQYSIVGLQQAVIEAVARDGEVLIQKVYAGDYGFALHIIEADYLDEDLNDTKKRIKGGVQVDQWGRPMAYYLFDSHPGDDAGTIYQRKHRRIPADQIIHLYVKERPGQTRGVPWLVTPAFRLKMLGAAEEAEVVASRVNASKMGFFISPDGEGYDGDDTEDDYTPITEATPGTFGQLPAGTDFKSWSPDHPNTAFEAFTKSILRGISSGLNVSYVGLANNLEGVSYSSIRQGELSDRDNWRVLQTWFVENFMQRIHEPWLTMALLSSKLKLPAEKMWKFNKPTWKPRGWNWVDPQKEIDANIKAVNNGFKTLSDIVGEQGKDLEDVFKTLAEEKKLAQQYGLELPVLFGDVTNGKKTDSKEDTGQANT